MLQVCSAAPGGWIVAAAPGGLAAVDLGRAPESVSPASLLEALESGDGVQAVLALLTAEGLSATPPFLLARADPRGLRCLVRGGIEVSVESGSGRERPDAAGASTWLERSFAGAASLSVVLEAGADRAGDDSATLPLDRGAAWARAFDARFDDVPAAPEQALAGPPAPKQPVAGQPEPAQEHPVAPEQPGPDPDRGAAPIAAPASRLDEETVFAPVRGSTPGEGDPAARAGAPTTPDPSEPSREEGRIRLPDSVTDSLPDRDALGDHDGLTVFTDELRTLRRSAAEARPAPAAAVADPAPASPPAEPAPAGSVPAEPVAPPAALAGTPAEAPGAPSEAVPALDLADGRTEPLDAPIIVGRAPSVSRVTGSAMPRLVTVSSAEQDISRSHVRLAVEGGAVVVTDLHSRNGTLVTLPGREPHRLRPGEPTTVLAGTVVDLGGGVTLTVRQGGA